MPHSKPLGLRTDIHLALRLWVGLTAAIVEFAVLATCLNVSGFTDEQSMFLALAVTVFTAAGTATLHRMFSHASTYTKGNSEKNSERERLSAHQLIRKVKRTLTGVSSLDLVVDLMRIAGLLGIFTLGLFTFLEHGLRIFEFRGGITFGIIFTISLLFIIFHEFIYPFLRKESVWETEYRCRKLAMARAISGVAQASVKKVDTRTLETIEQTTLVAIKSFVEFAVLDKNRNHINVNLLIEHPFDYSKLVCIRRTSNKKVPKIYNKEDMPTAVRVIETGFPIYVGRFVPSINTTATYKMVWQIPLILWLGENRKTTTAIIAIDSSIPDHLSMDDNRRSLLFNLMPYIELIRFTLTQRYVYQIWDDVIVPDAKVGHPYLKLLTPSQRADYLKYISAEERQDDIPEINLSEILNQSEQDNEPNSLKDLTTGLSYPTTRRKVFVALFPYVENNNRRIHG